MGIDIRHEIIIAFLKSIQWIIVNLWYWGVLAIILLIIRIYLAKKYKILSMDDLAYFFISILKKDKKTLVDYLRKESFPEDYIWLSPTEFVFGKHGSISFRDGNNDNRDAFQLLTEAKGEEVRVRKITNLLNINDKQTRVTMNNLSRRLKKDQKLAPFIDVIATNEGGYKLAIKADILKQ